MLVVYMKPRVRGQRTAEQDNYEKIQQDIDLQKRFGKYHQQLLIPLFRNFKQTSWISGLCLRYKKGFHSKPLHTK